MPALSRRAALAAPVAVVAVAMPAVAAVSPDAELLRLCAEMDAVQETMAPLEAEHGDTLVADPRYHELKELLREPSARWGALFDRLAETPAHTLEGMRAKAKVLRGTWNYWADGQPILDDSHEGLVWSLLDDLLAGAAA